MRTRLSPLGLAVIHEPAFLLPLLFGASSIATLLLYFYGLAEMGASVKGILLPAIVLLAVWIAWARRSGRRELFDRALAGLWAGGLATLAYDVVRLPIALSGVPVFKAISYFGTVILARQAPDLASEVAGWTYHLSNGIGFGLMYACLVRVPRWWTAVVWGLFLEAAMLLTPYAEIFGYKLSSGFLSISLGAHVVYGLVLWAALRFWRGHRLFGEPLQHRPATLLLAFALVPLGVGAVAADFHVRHAASIPPSPPPYVGPHLYTTWNSLEPDRLAALWILQRFVDHDARFHFVEPFSHTTFGVPFDIPEAEVRRSGALSATEVLLSRSRLGNDPKLDLLGRVGHLYEITPWMRPADPEAHQLGQELMAAAGRCPSVDVGPCVERSLRFLDEWYRLR